MNLRLKDFLNKYAEKEEYKDWSDLLLHNNNKGKMNHTVNAVELYNNQIQ